jgi:hypothetical protein
MKSILSIISAIVFLLLFSCGKETFDNQYRKGMLKRKLSYRWAQDTVPYLISEYEYDSRLRLKKIKSDHNVELFEYNQDNQLVRKSDYSIDADGLTLNDTTRYRYEDGKLVFEETNNLPPMFYNYTFQTNYEYENSKLIRKTKYRDHTFFESLTRYEYSGDLCTNEMYYNDSIGESINSIRSYIYETNVLSMSTLIGYASGNRKNWLQSVYYIYDDTGNLIIEYAEQSMETSAWIRYCYRYEYY